MPTNVTRWHRERHGEDFAFPRTLQTWTSYLPKSKSVEAFFNRSQSLEGTLWGCLGRDQRRRPYEKAKKLYEACRRGAADPREHFLSYDELVRRLNGMLEYLNGEPLEGEVFRGAPARVWEQAVGEYPLYRVAPAMQWLYRRDWAVVRITQGWARVRLTDGASGARYSLFYSNPEVFAAHEGDAVCVYYDREEFERPAQVILGRTGEYLCEAAYEERRGSFLSGDLSGHDVRKRWREAVLAAYGTVVKHAPSRQVPEEVAARRAMAGGRGELVVVDRRPAAGPEAAGARGEAVRPPGPEEWRRRGERLARQAEIAARLNALAGQGEGA